jgi:predicted alpha/beta hydrolase
MQAAAIEESTLHIASADGAAADLQIVRPPGPVTDVVLWLPALGVAARHYLPFAQALAARGTAVALHEWRGVGSSDRRAGRVSNWGYREILTQDIPASLAALRAAVPGARIWFGGHSLGGQLASLFAGMHPNEHAGLLLVASGAPYWRRFPRSWLIGAFIAAAPLIAALCGHFPGRRLHFGGSEARGVMADWARSGRTGRYAVAGMDVDLEALLATLSQPVLAVRLRDDWLGPLSSLDWLLGKMSHAAREVVLITSDDLVGAPADHFAWMKAPSAVAKRIVEHLASCPPSPRPAPLSI